MPDNPISSLSQTEFRDLMLDILSKNWSLKSTQNFLQSLEPPNETDVKCISWVSENCNLKLSTIRSMVSRGTIPSISRGKPLQFSKNKIIEWMENGRPKVNQVIDFAPIRKTKKPKN